MTRKLRVGDRVVFRNPSNRGDAYDGKLATVTGVSNEDFWFSLRIRFDDGLSAPVRWDEVTLAGTPIYDRLADKRRFSLDFVLSVG